MRIIHVLRKPLSEGTVAANTLKHGTGGLNIDAARIPTTPSERAEMLKMSQGFAGRKWGRPEIANYGYEASMPVKTVSVPSEGGRWPANVILQHLDGCGGVCEPGCPVARLDEQSGVLTSGVMKGQQRGWGFHGIYGASGNTEATCYGDTGGASRFYKQVGGSSE